MILTDILIPRIFCASHKFLGDMEEVYDTSRCGNAARLREPIYKYSFTLYFEYKLSIVTHIFVLVVLRTTFSTILKFNNTNLLHILINMINCNRKRCIEQ